MIPVSVIVAGHQQPDRLRRCLTVLAQLDCSTFEIVIAADEDGLSGLVDHPARPFIKTEICAEPIISQTPKADLALAGGDLVAPIDEEACARAALTAP